MPNACHETFQACRTHIKRVKPLACTLTEKYSHNVATSHQISYVAGINSRPGWRRRCWGSARNCPLRGLFSAALIPSPKLEAAAASDPSITSCCTSTKSNSGIAGVQNRFRFSRMNSSFRALLELPSTWGFVLERRLAVLKALVIEEQVEHVPHPSIHTLQALKVQGPSDSAWSNVDPRYQSVNPILLGRPWF